MEEVSQRGQQDKEGVADERDDHSRTGIKGKAPLTQSLSTLQAT